MIIESRVHAKNIVNWAKDKDNVLVLSADLTGSTEIDMFRDTYPEKFLSMGIAEQNMLSFAGGLAREGFIPLVHTFAVFIYRRAYDQISMSISYPNLPVKMFGFLPGITTPGGATHQAIEDISIMRSLPNMTILECGDATDVESVLDLAYSIDGPVYIRMLRGEIPRLFANKDKMKLNKSRILSKGKDLVVLTSGICTEQAIKAIKILEKQGLSIQLMHITTMKPFNDEEVINAIAQSKYGVITMENHSTIGGLGTIISEKIAEAGLNKKIYKMGINDEYVHGASRIYLMKKYKLDAMALIQKICDITGINFDIKENELDNINITPIYSGSKIEDL